MNSDLFLPSLVVSLIGFLIVGAGAFILMAITKISRSEFDKKITLLEARIEKERQETERLFSSKLEKLEQHIDFVVSGISDIKEEIKKRGNN